MKNDTALTRSTWIVAVSPSAKIKVRKGDQIKTGDLLAVLKKIKIKKLRFPSWLDKRIGVWQEGGKKQPGDRVEVNEILFEKAAFPKHHRWFSPLSGEILLLSEELPEAKLFYITMKLLTQ